MTTVHVSLTVPQRGTTTRAPAKGILEVSLYHREVEGGTFVLTPAFTQVLVDGAADLQLTPTTVGNAWVVNERVPGGRKRFVTVPDSPSTIAYTALVEVSPASLDPYPALASAYGELLARVALLEARPRVVVAGSGNGTVVVESSSGGVLTLSGTGVTESGGVIYLNSSNVTESNGVITIG